MSAENITHATIGIGRESHLVSATFNAGFAEMGLQESSMAFTDFGPTNPNYNELLGEFGAAIDVVFEKGARTVSLGNPFKAAVIDVEPETSLIEMDFGSFVFTAGASDIMTLDPLFGSWDLTNTDYYTALQAGLEYGITIEGAEALVLGAEGDAAAIVTGLVKFGAAMIYVAAPADEMESISAVHERLTRTDHSRASLPPIRRERLDLLGANRHLIESTTVIINTTRRGNARPHCEDGLPLTDYEISKLRDDVTVIDVATAPYSGANLFLETVARLKPNATFVTPEDVLLRRVLEHFKIHTSKTSDSEIPVDAMRTAIAVTSSL